MILTLHCVTLTFDLSVSSKRSHVFWPRSNSVLSLMTVLVNVAVVGIMTHVKYSSE